MTQQYLNINEVKVTTEPTVFTCYGLGSCLGVFISDRVNLISGGAHIPLPKSTDGGNFLGAESILNELFKQFRNLGSDLNCLRAKITGGAHVYSGGPDVGNQNTQSVLQLLISNKVYLAATDVGGSMSRTARFNTVTGQLRISTSEQKTYFI